MAKNVYIGVDKQFSVTNLLDYNALSGNDGGYWGQYTFGTRYVVWSATAPTGGNHSLLFNQNFSTGTAETTYQLTIKTGYIKVHLIPSHKYYFSVYLRQPSVVGSFDCYWPIAEPPVLQGVTVTAANTWQKKSTIVDRASFSEGDYEVRVDFNNPTTGSSLYVSNLVLVDLTATFGAGGEPDQAWCDANLDFNDTASDSAADTAIITATGSVARRAKNIYIGVGGKARKVKKAYVGVGGVARPFFGAGKLAYYGAITNLSYSRKNLAAATVGNYALFAGGFGEAAGSTSSNVVDAYDRALTRSTPTTLQSSRGKLSGTTVKNYALFAGGGAASSSSKYNYVDAYNTSLTRTTATELSISRYYATAVTIGNYALIAGGTTSSSSSSTLNSVETYNTSLTRGTATALSVARSKLSSATVGDYALIAGGSNKTSAVDAYNSALTKTTATALSLGRDSMGATSVGSYAIFAGGKQGSSSYRKKDVDAYNVSLTHVICEELNRTASFDSGATTVGDYALIAGGDINSSNDYMSKEVDSYDASLTHTNPTALTVGRALMGAATIGDYALFAGGLGDDSSCENTVEAYTLV